MAEKPILIIGAGVAGLCCAIQLQRAGKSVLVLEGSDAVGGRIRTDKVEGFLLDRGFQVFLTEYPEARRFLRYRGLQLKAFYPGALVRWCGRFHLLSDPFRKPHYLPQILNSRLATIPDGLRLTSWRLQLASMNLHTVFSRPEMTSLQFLEQAGYSPKFLHAFLKPFFAGVFLDPELETSSRMLEFTYKMFSSGRVTVPAQGMQAIPEQLSRELPRGSIRFESRVEQLDGVQVQLEGGEILEGAAVVIATEAPEAYRLLGRSNCPAFQSTTCLYFAAPSVPHSERPILTLNGDGTGPINHLVVNSRVSRSYAPDGQELVSVTILQSPDSPAQLEKSVRDQLREWYGTVVDDWRLLRSYNITQALPQQRPPWLKFAEKTVKVGSDLYLCGDHREHGSLQGAMRSGRRAAQELLSDL